MTAPPAAADEPASAPATPRRDPRLAIYLALVIVAASVTSFGALDRVALVDDEARYASCADVVRQTGQWLSITDVPGRTYFQKPPLYVWLTALTYDLLPREPLELRYRFWSGLFAVAAAAATCLLGATLLASPEAGLFAALLLAQNPRWLFVHGARAGTLDTGLTFLMVSCVLLYWRIYTGRSRWPGWVFIGVLLAAASLFKPLFGLLLGLPLALHALALGRATPRPLRFGGPVLALLLAALLAGPWYAVQYYRFGDAFLDEMFRGNVVHRLTVGYDPASRAGPGFYLASVSGSSLAFALFLPALAFCAGRAVKDLDRRGAYGLAVWVTIVWLGLFSFSRSKYDHYAYPVYPLVAIAVVALLGTVGAWLLNRYTQAAAARRHFAALALLAAGVLLARQAQIIYNDIPDHTTRYFPWETYQALRPAIEAGQLRVAFHGFGPTPLDWERNVPELQTRDSFYLRHMAGGAVHAGSRDEWRSLVAKREPVLLIVPQSRSVEVTADADLTARSDPRFAYERPSLLMRALDVTALTDIRSTPAAPGPLVQWLTPDGRALDAGPFDVRQGLMLRTTAPWRHDAWLSVSFQADARTDPAGCVVLAGGRALPVAEVQFRSTPDGYELSARIRHEDLGDARPVDLVIHPEFRGGGTLLAQVRAARLTFYLRSPPGR